MVEQMQGSKFLWTASILLCLFTQSHSIERFEFMDRAAQLSDKLHFLSTSLKSHLDSQFPTVGKKIPRLSMCHTSSLKTPIDKEQALRLPDSDLLSLVHSLLLSWKDPLLLLTSEASSLPQSSNGDIYSKTRELQENSHSLRAGIDKLVHMVSSSSQSNLPASISENSLGNDNNSRLINFQFLISCFRRDSHKIDNFLKILRCRADKMQPNAC